jgi:UDP-glucose 4-epimerase
MTDHSEKFILVTGGCGYIGTHTLVCLLEANYSAIVVDNLSNSSKMSLDRVAKICNLSEEERSKRLKFYEVDIGNATDLRKVFEDAPKFEACIHFAGLKAVGESSKIPLQYYENNIGGTFTLLHMLDEFKCSNLVFSSSATVYGDVDPSNMPITEDTLVGVGITNPYGRTKHMLEEILKDVQKATPKMNVGLLRYFNPVGSHPSGEIGEDPNGPPNNLMPYVSQVAVGRREKLTIFGDDYDTHDGTGVRDYLHVMDLARGHVSTIDYLNKKSQDEETKEGGTYTFNLGTGKGYSVLDMVKAMEKACGHKIPYEVGPRRAGDITVLYADPAFAKEELGWETKLNLEDMCRDLWCWQEKNPQGFAADQKK